MSTSMEMASMGSMSSSNPSATMASMSGMETGSMSMGMSMPMVFTNTQTSPLFSAAWTPDTTGKYAGTCIFLLVLAVISRLLLAYRVVLETSWHDKAAGRRYVVLAGESERDREKAMGNTLGEKEDAVLTSRGVDETVKVVRTARRGLELAPWRFSVDLPRALIFLVQAGVGYLLMLAVMTLNVGYFLSVLAGLFVGELAVGRYAAIGDGHH